MRPTSILLSAFLLLCASSLAKPGAHSTGKIAGVSLVSPPQMVDDAWTESVCRLNAGWVAIQPYAFSYPDQPEVRYNSARQWWGERLDGATELIRQARSNGLHVMLKPMVWIPGGWVGAYAMKDEANWKKWEESYRKYILENAAIAAREGVEIFCIGTEFNAAVVQRPKFWRKLAEEVRAVFPGKVTYAANWDNFEQVNFWDALDYIGVDAYFPLSPKVVPDVEELKRLWLDPAMKIHALHKRHDKPVLFTEFGYRSIDACSWQQWEKDNVPYHQQVNLAAQVNAYRAFFERFWHVDWFAGMFLWQWYTHDATAGGKDNSDYTPQNKPAAEVICSWFGCPPKP